MSLSINSYLAFVPAHTPSRHRVLAIVDRGDGAEADAVATFPDAPSATVLAAALNGVLQEQVTAERRLASVLTGAPDAVRAAVRDLLPALTSAREDPTALRVVRSCRRPGTTVSGCSRLPIAPIIARCVVRAATTAPTARNAPRAGARSVFR